jgi:hypothetical protein
LARGPDGSRLRALKQGTKELPPMTFREEKQPQDFHKMCKQAERDHESKKLVVLIERVKRQLEERGTDGRSVPPKPPVAAWAADKNFMRLPSRTALFER